MCRLPSATRTHDVKKNIWSLQLWCRTWNVTCSSNRSNDSEKHHMFVDSTCSRSGGVSYLCKVCPVWSLPQVHDHEHVLYLRLSVCHNRQHAWNTSFAVIWSCDNSPLTDWQWIRNCISSFGPGLLCQVLCTSNVNIFAHTTTTHA